MEKLSDELKTRFRHNTIVRKLIDGGRINVALEYYNRHHNYINRKSTLDMEIAEKLISVKNIKGKYIKWSDKILCRPSGVSLAFVYSQVTNTEVPNAPENCNFNLLCPKYKIILAEAWYKNPKSNFLRHKKFRFAFISSLVEEPACIGLCVYAAAACNDKELSQQLSKKWLSFGMLCPKMPEILFKCSKVAFLEDISNRAIDLFSGYYATDPQALFYIVGTAFHLKRFEKVIRVSQILIDAFTYSLSDTKKYQVLSWRLGALAEADRDTELAHEFSSIWLPTGITFPRPEWILYSFQKNGRHDLEKALLENTQIKPDTPEWVRLTKIFFQCKNNLSPNLKEWVEIYNNNENDERILVGITNALIRMPPGGRQEWTILENNLLQRWEYLFDNHPPFRSLSGAYLVLLQWVDQEIINEYERRFPNHPEVNYQVIRATRFYLFALRRTKQWSTIYRFFSEKSKINSAICSFEEYRFMSLMAELSILPDSVFRENSWWHIWEELLAYPLSNTEIIEIVDHFINLMNEFYKFSTFPVDETLHKDIRLQILWRAKKTVENLILNLEPADRPDETRIKAADLVGTYNLLFEIAAKTFRWNV